MATQLSSKRALDPPEIPDRLYFKIGDVARICGVETYVLRFWETQFPQLKPNKSGTGQRLYRRRDVELALKIKHLAHSEGYTLAGVRQALEHSSRRSHPRPEAQRNSSPQLMLLAADSGQPADNAATVLAHVRAELREIASLLASPDPQPVRRRSRVTAMPSTTGSLFPLD